MTQSMTAYARQSKRYPFGELSCELRAVNHRYLELNFRMPETLRDGESKLRDVVKAKLQRGKVDCNIHFSAEAGSQVEMQINQPLVESLLKVHQSLCQTTNETSTLNATQLMRWPGVLSTEETDMSAVQQALMELLQTALKDFIAAREREGEKLKKVILERSKAISKHVKAVKKVLPQIQQTYRDKLLARFEEAKVDLDPERLEHEMLLVAQKMDVAEELDRLTAHISELEHLLSGPGPHGRKLDFLMQEFNREANTLGSKSIDAQTTKHAVELKVLIEQMREQIQNLE